MIPAPRDSAHDRDQDLKLLGELYAALPHQSVRWQTEPGGRFLDVLFACVERYQAKAVANALGISTQGVYYMMERTRPAHPRAWPTQNQLRELNSAWRAVRAETSAGRSVRRKSPQYVPVHQALVDLLDQQFTLRDIALAMGVPTRQLSRFVQAPLGSPEAIARVIEVLLPTQAANRMLGDNPGWRE